MRGYIPGDGDFFFFLKGVFTKIIRDQNRKPISEETYKTVLIIDINILICFKKKSVNLLVEHGNYFFLNPIL